MFTENTVVTQSTSGTDLLLPFFDSSSDSDSEDKRLLHPSEYYESPEHRALISSQRSFQHYRLHFLDEMDSTRILAPLQMLESRVWEIGPSTALRGHLEAWARHHAAPCSRENVAWRTSGVFISIFGIGFIAAAIAQVIYAFIPIQACLDDAKASGDDPWDKCGMNFGVLLFASICIWILAGGGGAYMTGRGAYITACRKPYAQDDRREAIPKLLTACRDSEMLLIAASDFTASLNELEEDDCDADDVIVEASQRAENLLTAAGIDVSKLDHPILLRFQEALGYTYSPTWTRSLLGYEEEGLKIAVEKILRMIKPRVVQQLQTLNGHHARAFKKYLDQSIRIA